MTVDDSDTPYGKEQEDATDDEYAARPTNKKRKTSHLVSGPSSQQQRKTAAPTTSKVSRRRTAPQELQMETKPAPSRKRKAAPAEVIDLSNAAPPPPKRKATMRHMTARTPATGEGQATRHQPQSEAHVSHVQNAPLQSQETLPAQPPKMHPSKLPSRVQDLHPVRVQPSGEIDPSTTAEDLIARGMVKDLAQVVGILLARLALRGWSWRSLVAVVEGTVVLWTAVYPWSSLFLVACFPRVVISSAIAATSMAVNVN
tara:strand:- start:21846 stop:22616 length:771 start_codon:yes stop_codon:yes gene_type:complete